MALADPHPSAAPPGRPPLAALAGRGRGIVRASWAGTAVFTLTAVAAAIAPGALTAVAVAVALALFAAGCVVFLWAYAIAVGRSRTDAIGIGGLFFLAGSAPRAAQLHLMGSFGVEVVVALTTAALRPFTGLAFGTLVPVFGLGLAGLWGARHGTFGPRAAPAQVPAPASAEDG
ncbi:MAG: hypothetical protein IPM45_16755 [Acidimicrobiales bacterium]|nr:hypothetical protein [Acidimicrobiales bacterium]